MPRDTGLTGDTSVLTFPAVEAIGVEVDAGSVAVGQALLARQLTSTLATNRTGVTDVSTRATVGQIRLQVDTDRATLGEAALAGQLTLSVRANFA